MNYGYNENTKNWNDNRKWLLAEELENVLNIPIETRNKAYVNDGVSPYIEVDGSYGGVRIRRITHLSEKKHEKLVRDADKVYHYMMVGLLQK